MSSLTGFVKRIRDIMWNDAGVNGDAQRIEQMAWILFLKVYNTKEEEWRYTDRPYTSIIPEECRWNNWAADDKSGKAMTGDTLLDFVNNKLFPTLKGLNVTAATPIKKAIVKTTFEDANNYMKDGVLLRQVINIIDDLDLDDYEESHAFGEIYESILRELQSAGSSGEFYTPRAVTDFMAKTIKPKLGEKVADFACGTGGFLTSWLNELSKQVVTAEDQQEYATSIYGIEKKPFPYTLCITNMLLHGIDVPMVYHDNSLLRDVLDYTEEDQFDVVLMNPPYGGHEKTEVKNHFPADLASSETADLFMSVIMYRLKQNGRAAVILPDGFLFGTDNAKISWLNDKHQESGFIFLNKYGDRITTRGISGQLKKLAVRYGIDPVVVYPHSFRHRFAKSFLERCNDIAFLADLMGHESIETTRIYLRKTSTEQRAIVDEVIDW